MLVAQVEQELSTLAGLVVNLLGSIFLSRLVTSQCMVPYMYQWRRELGAKGAIAPPFFFLDQVSKLALMLYMTTYTTYSLLENSIFLRKKLLEVFSHRQEKLHTNV